MLIDKADKRQMRSATPISFAPVRVAEETSSAATLAGCGTIEIELAGAPFLALSRTEGRLAFNLVNA